MTILACGSCTANDPADIFAALDRQHADAPISRVIHAGAPGVDRLAAQWASDHGVMVQIFPCHCAQDGMVNWQLFFHGNPDLVLTFKGGRGTENVVSMAQAAGVPVKRVA